MKVSKLGNIFIVIGLGVFLILLLVSFLDIPNEYPEIAKLALESVPKTGVSNSATAVLLSFRAFDTFLELAVLALSLLGVLGLGSRRVEIHSLSKTSHHPVLSSLTLILAPLLALTGAYLLIAGTKTAGGAFQGGAVLAVLGVLLIKVGIIEPLKLRLNSLVFFALSGLLSFFFVGAIFMLIGTTFLEFPSEYSYAAIFILELFITFSTAVTLTLLYAYTRAMLMKEEV